MRTDRIILLLMPVALLCSCVQRPDAEAFLAPELGEVSVKVDEYKAVLSCTVQNVREGETFGFRYGETEGVVSVINAIPENGLLKAEIIGLEAPAEYVVTAFVSSRKDEIISAPVKFSVKEAGGAAAVITDPVFRRYCLANFDTNADGRISAGEASLITVVNVCTDSIYTVKGIEYFPNLLELHARGGMLDGEFIRKGQLMFLDVSGNPHLRIIDCQDNKLRELDLSHNTELRELNASWNYITSIDVTMLPLLTYLNVSVNEEISSVDLTRNTRLLGYHGNGLNLSGLPDLSNCHSLSELHIANKGGGKWIDRPDYLSQWPDLYNANISGFPLKEIELSGNTKLEAIWADDMLDMELFDLSPLSRLREIYVNRCSNLKKILVNDAVDISSLYIEREGTGELDIRHLPKKPSIEFPDAEFEKYLLSEYDTDADGYISFEEAAHIIEIKVDPKKVRSLEGIEYLVNLERLEAGEWENFSGQLVSVDLRANKKLQAINVSGNRKLDELLLSDDCKDLVELHCTNTRLASIDVRTYEKLKILDVSDSKISSIDVTHNPELELYGGNTLPLKDVPDLSHNPKLTDIHICSTGGAEFIGKDFFCSWPKLKRFNMGCYKGSEINLSLNTEMQDVWAPEIDRIKVLDLSASPYLRFISVNYSDILETIIVNDAVDISKLEIEREDCAPFVIRHKSEMD